jgi:hypothetical protein
MRVGLSGRAGGRFLCAPGGEQIYARICTRSGHVLGHIPCFKGEILILGPGDLGLPGAELSCKSQ